MDGEVRAQIQNLLRRCEDEMSSPADGAVLRSQFRGILTAETIGSFLSEAIECEAFVLGACDAAEEAGWTWPGDVLVHVGEMAAHLGLQEEAERLAFVCVERMPGSTGAIVLWAETSPSGADAIDRYLQSLLRASDKAAVESAARHYASHSPDSQMLLQRLEAGLRGLRSGGK